MLCSIAVAAMPHMGKRAGPAARSTDLVARKKKTSGKACRDLGDAVVVDRDDDDDDDDEGDDCGFGNEDAGDSFDVVAINVAPPPEEPVYEVHDVFGDEYRKGGDGDQEDVDTVPFCFFCFFEKVNQNDAAVRRSIQDLEARSMNMASTVACRTNLLYKFYKNTIQPTLVDYGCPAWSREVIAQHVSGLHKFNKAVMKERYLEFCARSMDLLQRSAFIRHKVTGCIQPQFAHLKMIDKMANTAFGKI